MPLIIDTTVLIDYLRLYDPAIKYFDLSEKRKEIQAISVVSAMEVLQGCRDKKSFILEPPRIPSAWLKLWRLHRQMPSGGMKAAEKRTTSKPCAFSVGWFIIVQKFLSCLRILHISEQMSKRAFALQQKYHLSHRLSLPDSFIASTALVSKASLVTSNLKDFEFIPLLKIISPY